MSRHGGPRLLVGAIAAGIFGSGGGTKRTKAERAATRQANEYIAETHRRDQDSAKESKGTGIAGTTKDR